MLEKLKILLLIIPGIIHLLPLSGVFGENRLSKLYGIPFSDPNLQILMQHRAVLFGLLGTFLIFSAFKPQYQTIAIIAGLISTISFIVIAFSVGDFNEAIRKVVIADVIAIVCLLGALVIFNTNSTFTDV